MEIGIKNAFLPDFDLNFTCANFDEIFGMESLTLICPKNSEKSLKIFLSTILYEMFPL
jgi:hypothetical protein